MPHKKLREEVRPGKSGLHAHGEGELVITLESWEAARSSRGVEEGLSRSFSSTISLVRDMMVPLQGITAVASRDCLPRDLFASPREVSNWSLNVCLLSADLHGL